MQSGNATRQRGLAAAGLADHGHALSRVQPNAHVMKHRVVTVPGLQIANREQRANRRWRWLACRLADALLAPAALGPHAGVMPAAHRVARSHGFDGWELRETLVGSVGAARC